jgi:hypothetical protein
MKSDKELSITEELDFQYLLQLLPPLEDTPEFSWLPELFSIIGAKNLITLCKYVGGETIKIPTIEQLSKDIDALQWYYDVYISHKKNVDEIPIEFIDLVLKIKSVYQST